MSRRIKRREFVVLLGGAAAAWPLAARAQQAAMPVIGYFSARSPDTEAPLREPFLRALEKLGFAAGRNIAIEYRFAEGQDGRLPVLAAEHEFPRLHGLPHAQPATEEAGRSMGAGPELF